MSEIKKSAAESKDYKERFEFELTVGNNIICQRYFRINNFNQTALRSYELTEAVRNCVAIIDRDLKDKAHIYLEMYAPKVFDSIEQMEAYVADPSNADRLVLGEGLVVRGNSKTDYVYTKKGEFLRTYKSIRSMCEDLHINRKTVTMILKGEKTTNNYDYLFEYVEESQETIESIA